MISIRDTDLNFLGRSEHLLPVGSTVQRGEKTYRVVNIKGVMASAPDRPSNLEDVLLIVQDLERLPDGTTIKERVLALLAPHHSGLTHREIVERLNVKGSSLSAILTRLKDAGEVVCKEGTWYLI